MGSGSDTPAVGSGSAAQQQLVDTAAAAIGSSATTAKSDAKASQIRSGNINNAFTDAATTDIKQLGAIKDKNAKDKIPTISEIEKRLKLEDGYSFLHLPPRDGEEAGAILRAWHRADKTTDQGAITQLRAQQQAYNTFTKDVLAEFQRLVTSGKTILTARDEIIDELKNSVPKDFDFAAIVGNDIATFVGSVAIEFIKEQSQNNDTFTNAAKTDIKQLGEIKDKNAKNKIPISEIEKKLDLEAGYSFLHLPPTKDEKEAGAILRAWHRADTDPTAQGAITQLRAQQQAYNTFTKDVLAEFQRLVTSGKTILTARDEIIDELKNSVPKDLDFAAIVGNDIATFVGSVAIEFIKEQPPTSQVYNAAFEAARSDFIKKMGEINQQQVANISKQHQIANELHFDQKNHYLIEAAQNAQDPKDVDLTKFWQSISKDDQKRIQLLDDDYAGIAKKKEDLIAGFKDKIESVMRFAYGEDPLKARDDFIVALIRGIYAPTDPTDEAQIEADVRFDTFSSIESSAREATRNVISKIMIPDLAAKYFVQDAVNFRSINTLVDNHKAADAETKLKIPELLGSWVLALKEVESYFADKNGYFKFPSDADLKLKRDIILKSLTDKSGTTPPDFHGYPQALQDIIIEVVRVFQP